MKSLKFLHCADIHIGAAQSFLGAGAESRRMEVLLTFEKIMNIAAENAVDIVFIAGDLFDSNNIPSSLIDRSFKAISSISPIPVIISAGNHDPLSSNSPLRSKPDNLYCLPTHDSFICFEDLRLRVYGCSFSSVYKNGAPHFSLTPPDDNFNNIMVIHGDLFADPDSDYNPISRSFLESSGMDYVALGHIHKRCEPENIGKTVFAYSGCPEGQGFDEDGEKGIYLGEIGDNGCTLKFLPTCRRQHITREVDISECTEGEAVAPLVFEKLKSEFGDRFSQNLYKIILKGDIPDGFTVPTAELSARLGDATYFSKVKDNTSIKLDLEELLKSDDLKGVFARKLLERINTADESERPLLQKALQIGLAAFSSEVGFNEDI